MKTKSLVISALILMALLVPQKGEGRVVSKDDNVVVVQVTGKGATKEEARRAAYRTAVEEAVGVYVDAESVMQNYEMVMDRINTISNADIKKVEKLDEMQVQSGQYVVFMKARVEKKAITPKFKDVFPNAFADVGNVASDIHAQIVSEEQRAKDAASLMKAAALSGADRMRDWVRVSVVEGRELALDSKDNKPDASGKRKYWVRFSLKVNEDAYFKGFVPHFKEVLQKIHEGSAAEDVLLSVRAVQSDGAWIAERLHKGYDATPINPFEILDIPSGSYNIFLVDKINKNRTVMRCSAYKVPDEAFREYWKSMYGDLVEKCEKGYGGEADKLNVRLMQKVEVRLLDAKGDEIDAKTHSFGVTLLTGGFPPYYYEFGGKFAWHELSDFKALALLGLGLIVRPYFAGIFEKGSWTPPGGYDHVGIHTHGENHFVFTSELQRSISFRLTNAQLAEVKRVEVRFVGPGSAKRK